VKRRAQECAHIFHLANVNEVKHEVREIVYKADESAAHRARCTRGERNYMSMEKKALLVISFGTSRPETRDRTIGSIERDLATAFPDRQLYTAWTSRMIIRIVAAKEGRTVDTPEQAIERIAADGCRDLLVQPTHLLDGYENQRMNGILAEAAGKFDAIHVGEPLLTSDEDLREIAGIISRRFQPAEENGILLLMGHGTSDGKAEKMTESPNRVYHRLQELFRETGRNDIYVATVEGKPSFDTVHEAIRQAAPAKVVLAPLMVVAGEHAVTDMAGEGEDSWKSQLLADGFRTEAVPVGLGEIEEIRRMYTVHAMHALKADAGGQIASLVSR